MTGPERKYVLDTNLFVDGWRDARRRAELIQFHRLFAPFEYLNAVVAHELCAGAPSAADRKELERSVFEPFRANGRLVTPSRDALHKAGDAIARIARADGLAVSAVTRAFGNDVLIALSCREAGMTLVTRNTHDFGRIASVVTGLRFVGPWPSPSS